MRKEITVGEGGERRWSVRLKKGGLPSALTDTFEILMDEKDQHSRRVNRKFDKMTGLPFEIRNKQTGPVSKQMS